MPSFHHFNHICMNTTFGQPIKFCDLDLTFKITHALLPGMLLKMQNGEFDPFLNVIFFVWSSRWWGILWVGTGHLFSLKMVLCLDIWGGFHRGSPFPF